ncbi:MAG: hypothetical protein M1834_002654 [Cirrosporium novae-zelandiae]|nr:MAG: hypothetical protein M1834_002654 [Cirrosporium novae-zelandiae]
MAKHPDSVTGIKVPEDEEIQDITPTGTNDYEVKPDWPAEEEIKVKRKVDFIFLPLLMLAFFALQMDRGNISAALTDTITEDLGISTNQINIGNQLLSAGIVILEIPSNVILQRIGPQKWLAGQIMCWGLVATLQLFATNLGGYLATRLLLGLCEAGFIPGALYIMSTWYKKSETSLRVSIFFLGNILAVATSALIGAGILTLAGKHGLAGWQWLFLIEGVMSIGIGIIFLLFIPPTVGDGVFLLSRLAVNGRWSYFTEQETYILRRRVLLDDPNKAHGAIRIAGSDIMDALKKPRIWVHVLITLLATIPVNALGTYSPSIIKSLGFGKVKANAMYSVGIFAAAVFVVILGFSADWTKRRGPFALIAATWSLITYAVLKSTPSTAGRMHRYAIVVLANVTNSTVHIINVGWLSTNCIGPQQRSVAMAMIIMAANAAGIAGSQVFRDDDKPLYHRAFTTITALAAASEAVVIGQMVWYFASNRILAKKPESEVELVVDEGLVKRWWWTW